ncbi:MAG: hypothetical protein MZV63_21110 [Marinilabiliales bacterium]|nr:hypothetical protein [Marinilabiliales bacterium]
MRGNGCPEVVLTLKRCRGLSKLSGLQSPDALEYAVNLPVVLRKTDSVNRKSFISWQAIIIAG